VPLKHRQRQRERYRKTEKWRHREQARQRQIERQKDRKIERQKEILCVSLNFSHKQKNNRKSRRTTFKKNELQNFFVLKFFEILWKPLIAITLSQTITDPINPMIT